MKHFRDLVLSTKEPAVKNVLWIDPVKDEETGKYILGEYRVKMYEDGWKVLFGGGGEGSNGLGFEVLNSRTGLTLLYDVRDPNNRKKIYPITKAVNVYLNNGIDVETAINNINRALNNINNSVRKICVVDELDIDFIENKQGKSFWVYTSGSNGTLIGPNYIRKYTTNSTYTSEYSIGLGDVFLDFISTANAHRMYVVNDISGSNVTVETVAYLKDVMNLAGNVRDRYLRDVLIDNDSTVVTTGSGSSAKQVSKINRPIREVYMVQNATSIATNYSTGKAGKIFFYIENVDDVNVGHLIKYTSNTAFIPLEVQHGDLFFNLDTFGLYEQKQLYVFKEGTYNNGVYDNAAVEILPDYESINTLLFEQITDAIDNTKDLYIPFTASNEHTSGNINTTIWDITNDSDYGIADIDNFVNEERTIYAVVSGIESQVGRSIPLIIPLTICGEEHVKFTISVGTFVYILEGFGYNAPIWLFSKTSMQTTIRFDLTPTENSNNAVTSGGVYAALEDKADVSDLDNYVLLNSTSQLQVESYLDRMLATPKFHRVEWLDDSEEYEPGTNIISDRTTHYISGGQQSAWGCFVSLWWAVHDCNRNSADEIPKLIVRRGNVSCYCWADVMTIAGVNDATEIRLRFFDGENITAYKIEKITDAQYGNCMRVTVTQS